MSGYYAFLKTIFSEISNHTKHLALIVKMSVNLAKLIKGKIDAISAHYELILDSKIYKNLVLKSELANEFVF